MRLRSRIAWLAAGMVLSTVVSAYAQAKPAQPGPYPPPAPPYPRFEVSGGYQMLHVPDQTFPFGLNIDGAINTSKLFGIAGEAGWATDKVADTRVHVWNLGVGPRINGRPMGGKVWPFAQVLVGLQGTLKLELDRKRESLYIQTYTPDPLSQVLYRLDLKSVLMNAAMMLN